MKFEKPPEVREAQITGDKKKLARMGKKGGEMSAEVRHMKKISADEAVRQQEIDMKYWDIFHNEGEEAAEAYKAQFEELQEAS